MPRAEPKMMTSSDWQLPSLDCLTCAADVSFVFEFEITANAVHSFLFPLVNLNLMIESVFRIDLYTVDPS